MLLYTKKGNTNLVEIKKIANAIEEDSADRLRI